MSFNALKNLIQTYWPEIKLFIKFYVTLYFKLTIRLVHFFSKTYVGYSIYIFCFFYGFFGCHGTTCGLSHSLAGYFTFLMISLAFEIWILVKIPATRKFLDQLVGADYIIKYLGKFTGSISMLRYISPIVAVAVAEGLTQSIESANNRINAKAPLDEYWKNVEKSGNPHDPKSSKYAEATKRSHELLSKPAQGIFTKTTMGENMKDNIKSVLSTVNNLFGGKK